MTQYRMSFQFQAALSGGNTGGSLYGWTENWYYSGNTNQAGITLQAAAWVQARRAILTLGWRISRCRFAVWPLTRTAFTVNYAPGDGTGTYPVAAGAIGDEQPYDVLVCNGVGASGGAKNFPLGGIGVDVVNAGGIYTGSSTFNPLFNLWVAQVVGGGNAFSRRMQTLPAVNPNTNTPIMAVWTQANAAIPASMLPSPTRPVIQLPTTVVSVSPLNYCRISGVKGEFNVNGIWRIAAAQAAVSGYFVWLRPKRGQAIVGTWLDGGTFTEFYYGLDPMASITPSRGSSRKRGGAPGRPRGRRSVRRS